MLLNTNVTNETSKRNVRCNGETSASLSTSALEIAMEFRGKIVKYFPPFHTRKRYYEYEAGV